MEEKSKLNFSEEVEKLKGLDRKTPYFTFEGEKHLCKVVKCYDGDTIHCVFKYGGDYRRFKVRMSGYDSPEMRPSKKLPEEERKEIKKKAKEARRRLRDLIMNKVVFIQCDGSDKYGRLLGTIKLQPEDEKSVNSMMVEEGFGYVYHGGKKRK